MDTQAKQHLLSTLCELGFCIGLDKSFFIVFPNFANFWLGHHPGGVLGISSDRDDRMEPKVKTQKNP